MQPSTQGLTQGLGKGCGAAIGRALQQGLLGGAQQGGAMHGGLDQVGEPSLVLLQLPVLLKGEGRIQCTCGARRLHLLQARALHAQQAQLPEQAGTRQVVGSAAVQHQGLGLAPGFERAGGQAFSHVVHQGRQRCAVMQAAGALAGQCQQGLAKQRVVLGTESAAAAPGRGCVQGLFEQARLQGVEQVHAQRPSMTTQARQA